MLMETLAVQSGENFWKGNVRQDWALFTIVFQGEQSQKAERLTERLERRETMSQFVAKHQSSGNSEYINIQVTKRKIS